MVNYNHLKGTGVALITPFNKEKQIDYPALAKLIEHCISGGVETLISMGTTGESVTLTKEEKAELLAFTIKQTAGRAQIVVGIGGNNTQEVADEMEALDPTGITAILSSSPAYNKPSQEGIYQHYMALEKVAKLPIIIYNVPGRTASNLTAETTLRLAHASTKFAAVKEASGDLVQATKIIKDRPDHFLVLSGDDPLALALVGIGGDGVISVIGNAYPKEFSQMIQYALKGDFKSAQKLNNALFDLHKWLYIDGNPSGIKAACHLLEICENEFRLPLVPMAEAHFKKLKEAMEAIKWD
ncbi:MAG: 4-hydroxy-tetrahydrodipicolinate synthase [Saprospiraceae bacterium]|nr:4-hydroxy-tetrahydrodipicolinate synthase [Candidatus Vicinibacter affinis]MBK9641590.1 4-hydroxy-tetrahydrodipicolinate synthase [Candidatus Vicinibacter affinis]